MEPFMTVADLFSRSALHERANSALPNAPVQPATGPRRTFAQYPRRVQCACAPTPTLQIRRATVQRTDARPPRDLVGDPGQNHGMAESDTADDR